MVELQEPLQKYNALVRSFKTEDMHSDDHKIIIIADKRPTQFIAPTIDEIAVVIVGENVESHDSFEEAE